MITYFPLPYPDELFISTISRYYIHSGLIMVNDLYKQLFSSYSRPCFDFLNKYGDDFFSFISSIKPFSQIVLENTMYPYYSRFTLNNKSLYNSLCKNESDYYKYIPISCVKKKKVRYIRYCPVCAEEDRKEYGETYWHRKHQIPEISICTKHCCRLVNTKIIIENKSMSRFWDAESNVLNSEQSEITEKEFEIGKYITDVFDSEIMFEDCRIRSVLGNSLFVNGYASVKDGIRRINDLYNDITEYYHESIKDVDAFEFLFRSNVLYPYDVCLIGNYLKIPVNKLFQADKEIMSLEDMITDLFWKNKNFAQISKQLETSYDYVYHVCVCRSLNIKDQKRFDNASSIAWK